MLKTNSKEVNEKIKNLIIASYENCEEYYSFDNKEVKTKYNDICKDILQAFENEKCKHDNRYLASRISKYDLFYEWLQGLPTSFDIADDIFLGYNSAKNLVADLLEQTEVEKNKYTEEQSEQLIVKLLYRELTKHANK